MCIFIRNILDCTFYVHVNLENTFDVHVNWFKASSFVLASAKLGQRTCVDVNWDTISFS